MRVIDWPNRPERVEYCCLSRASHAREGCLQSRCGIVQFNATPVLQQVLEGHQVDKRLRAANQRATVSRPLEVHDWDSPQNGNHDCITARPNLWIGSRDPLLGFFELTIGAQRIKFVLPSRRRPLTPSAIHPIRV
jgi:hypothetical protein